MRVTKSLCQGAWPSSAAMRARETTRRRPSSAPSSLSASSASASRRLGSLSLMTSMASDRPPNAAQSPSRPIAPHVTQSRVRNSARDPVARLRSAPRGRQRETTDALARADANVGHRASSDATTNATGRSSEEEEEEEEEEGRAEPSPAESSQRVSRTPFLARSKARRPPRVPPTRTATSRGDEAASLRDRASREGAEGA